MHKEEILSIEEIKKVSRNIKDETARKNYIKSFLEKEEYTDIKKDLTKEIVPIIVKEPLSEYNLIYDSLSEGLEPIYFWMVDTLSDKPPAGLGLDVWKGTEEFEASVTSGYFGEIGQRATLMQQKAMEYLGTINNIIKSVLNLIYDLKEFEIKLKPYDDLKNKDTSKDDKKAAIYAIKGVWMDQVDARKGRGSINLLAQDLQFITLRDAFFVVDKTEDIEKIDLNERVKNILERKLKEFNDWKEFSEEEIRKRYTIEKEYLRSQYGTIKLYANWLKPYLIAAQKLKMRGIGSDGKINPRSLTNPNIVNSFSNMEIEIKVYGKKELSPGSIHESFKEIEIDTKYYALTEITMKFRSVPSTLSGQGGRQYVHGGRVDIIFKGYAVDKTELDAIEAIENYQDMELIDNYIGTSLSLLQDEIEKYLKGPNKKEERPIKKHQGFDNPFKGLFDGFMQIYNPISDTFFKQKRKGPQVVYDEMEGFSKKQAKSQTYLIYNLYKRTHAMPAT